MNEKKTQPTGKFQVECDDNAEELINKILKLQEREERASSRKFARTITILIGLAVAGLIGYSVYKNGASTEAVLSTLLAFFSIFMSVLFYFKSDEASKSFYDLSYNFMKDASVMLGRIEERFGAQLSNLNEKITQFNQESREASEQIHEEETEKYDIINDLIKKAGLEEDERKHYTEALKEKDEIIRSLERKQINAMQSAALLKSNKFAPISPAENLTYINILSDTFKRKKEVLDIIDKTLEKRKLPADIPNNIKALLNAHRCINEIGDIRIGNLMNLRTKIKDNKILF